MARIRTIKPEFFTSETIAALPLTARLTFIGIWTHSDDKGRCRDNAKLIEAAVWPLDEVGSAAVAADLDALAAAGLIIRYTTRDHSHRLVPVIQIRAWEEHQRVNRPGGSKWQPPGPDDDPFSEDSVRTHGRLTEDSVTEQGTGNREQGTGNVGTSRAARATRTRADAHTRGADPRDATTASELAATAHPAEAHTLVERYAASCAHRPASSIRRKLAAHVTELLALKWPPELITESLNQWGRKGLDPKAFPSVANEVANKQPEMSTGDQRVKQALSLMPKYAAEEGYTPEQVQALLRGEHVEQPNNVRHIGTGD